MQGQYEKERHKKEVGIEVPRKDESSMIRKIEKS